MVVKYEQSDLGSRREGSENEKMRELTCWSGTLRARVGSQDLTLNFRELTGSYLMRKVGDSLCSNGESLSADICSFHFGTGHSGF